jgi:leucyl-tRNA synthetase
MDGFACSSWYFLRFVSPHYEDGPFDPAALAQWGPPDLYVGGAEHAVMHLLYARFWTKVMADAGIVPFREPFPKLRSQGVMHARDPQTSEVRRMSKSASNVVTPDSVAAAYGADALRIYLLFMAPFENNTVWEEDGIVGAKRFLQRFWRLALAIFASPPHSGGSGDVHPSPPRSGGSGDSSPTVHPSPPRSGGSGDSSPTVHPSPPRSGGSGDSSPTVNTQLRRTIHRTIHRVTADVEAFKFNTAIAALMECLNEMSAHHHAHGVTPALAEATRTFVLLLAPFAPHIAEELWARLGGPYSVHQQAWPVWDEALAAEETVTLVVQVDGRVRDRLTVPADIEEAEARERGLNCDGVHRQLDARRVARVIYVPGRLVNIVTDVGIQ